MRWRPAAKAQTVGCVDFFMDITSKWRPGSRFLEQKAVNEKVKKRRLFLERPATILVGIIRNQRDLHYVLVTQSLKLHPINAEARPAAMDEQLWLFEKGKPFVFHFHRNRPAPD
jgi:hypothetical protein